MASSWSRVSLALLLASCSSWSSCSRSSSARLRSLMSRIVPVNIGGSAPSTRVMASSTGISVPSACMPVSSTRRPIRTDSPVSTVRRRAARWASRYLGGITTSASSLPIASSARRPNMLSAAGLNSATIPRWSITMTASSEEASSAALRASPWRTASPASSRVMNSPMSVPSAVVTSSISEPDSVDLREKSSMTARQRWPLTTGKATPSRILERFAASARTKLSAATASARKIARPPSQTWPGKPTPGCTARSSVARSKSGT